MTDIWEEKPSMLLNRGIHEVGINPEFIDWLDKLKTQWKILEYTNYIDKKIAEIIEVDKKLEAIKKQVIEPQLRDSKEYLDTHTKPEPHSREMSRYWLEKGIYGTVSEINKILEEDDV